MKGQTPKRDIKLSKVEINRIVAQQKKEFPGDWALQQVHIARKILAREAELAGMDYIDYIRSIAHR